MNLDFFDVFPLLETPRLLLRELRDEDAEPLFAIFSDEEVTRFYDVETMDSVEAAHGIVARMRKRFEDGIGVRWAIVARDSGAMIGSCGYNQLAPAADRGVLGYELRRDRWGQGLATEAVQAMVAFGHRRMGLHRIEALVMLENEGSARVLRKAGFTEEGILRGYGRWKGRYHDLRMFSILPPG